MALSQQNNVAVGKRKREGDAAPLLGDHGEGSCPPPKKSASKRKNSAASPRSSLQELPMRLEAFPDMIEDALNGTSPGKCPRCGDVEIRKNGRVKIRGRMVQKYLCKGCAHGFRVPAPRELGFEAKRNVQRLFRRAHGELAGLEMAADELAFERRMASLQSQLRAKRRSVSKLLGIALEEDCEGADPTASVDAEGGGINLPKKAPQAENPLKEIMLLLRDETPKLERAVDGLLLHHRNCSSIAEVQGGMANVIDSRRQLMAEEEEFSSTVDIMNDKMPECNEKYKLMSRITQEDGEEIEIFEKCNHDDH